MKKIMLLAVVAAGLAGCGDDAMPEPNAATCKPPTYQQALSEIKSEAKRAAFIEECKAFQKAQDMRKWEFKPSPADNF
ncbi:entry exclusion lipoprotein TrbK (plasmid) [Xanthomonas sp. NCPPB 1638]|uniref:entry exclusion lipoprotein TrbK n=1 Tax=Xanthomonas TaxID=338 RepID=UPI001AD65B5C|nr:entry exclusion lipoprotein TrbK [Xanthomonas cucurbitae]WDM77487.1 entry exclusion lipoprotein TrbK [Xanthomonas cucurbitae]